MSSGKFVINTQATNAIIESLQNQLDSGLLTEDAQAVAQQWIKILQQIAISVYAAHNSFGIGSVTQITPSPDVPLPGTTGGAGLTLPGQSYFVDFNGPGGYNVTFPLLGGTFNSVAVSEIINAVFGDPSSGSFPNPIYVEAIQANSTAINSLKVVGIIGVGNTVNPILSTIAAVTSTSQTGVLGIAFLTNLFTTSSSVAGTVWIVQTQGQFFDSSITGATVGAPVYYDATGTPTLTSAGNIKFGFVTSSDLTGSWINIVGFTQ